MLHALASSLQAEPFAIAKWKTTEESPKSDTHMESCVALMTSHAIEGKSSRS